MAHPTRTDLKTACETLADRDLVLARIYATLGVPDWRAAPASFETLARSVIYQLLSTKAAATIWGRVAGLLDGDVNQNSILATDETALRACGVSRPKIRHIRAIAEAVQTGALDFNRLKRSDIGQARGELVAVKGIGPWTAEIFLMNAVGHLDAFPVGDVGLMEGYRRAAEAPERLGSKPFSELAETWRPYRGVAAHLLWNWRNNMP